MKFFIILFILISSKTTFAQSKIHCTGISGKLKMTMELEASIRHPNELLVFASMTGKEDMTGQLLVTKTSGKYEGPLTEYGDPLEAMLVFPENYRDKKFFQARLELEDDEVIFDFDLTCFSRLHH